MWPDSLKKYEYPNGSEWNNLFRDNIYQDPRTSSPPQIESAKAR